MKELHLQMIGGANGLEELHPAAAYRQPIGEQTWTDRNLDVATYRDGTAIPEEQDPDKWENLKTGAWCYYENNQKAQLMQQAIQLVCSNGYYY
jgi:hypothetical protein